MFGYNEHHKSHHFNMLHSELGKIYFFKSLFSFAQSLIFVFIPIFLYNKSISLISILLYSMTIYLSVLLVDPLAISLIKKIGFKWALLVSIPFSVLNFLTINLVTNASFILYLSAFFQGIHLAIFFTALNAQIATKGHNKKRGNEIGTLNIVMTLLSTFSSLVGGLILSYFNYTILIFVFFILTCLSTIPLIKSKDLKLKKFNFSYKDYIGFFKKKDFNTKIFYLNEGADMIFILYLWPIALFLLVGKSFTNLGLLLTASSIISAIIIFLIKKKLDQKSKEFYLKFSAKIISLEYILKFCTYLFTSYLVYLVEIIRKINRNIFSVSYTSIYYNNAKKQKYLDYILFCDFFGRIGRISFGILLMIIFLIFGQSIDVLFYTLLLGILVSFGLHFLKEIENR
jgi:MFS family permease